MRLKISRMDVWSAELDDQPGALARTLRAIAGYGADLECVLARRQPDKKGKGVVYITPLKGKEQLENAGQAGFQLTSHLSTLKIEGTDRPGLGAELAKAIGDAGVNLHGLTAATVGRRFVCYASFDTVADMEKAEKALLALSHELHRSWLDMIGRKSSEKIKVPA